MNNYKWIALENIATIIGTVFLCKYFGAIGALLLFNLSYMES